MGDNSIEFPGYSSRFDPLSVGGPRADFGVKQRLEKRIGPELTDNVLDTAHEHQMRLFYMAPRMRLEVASERFLRLVNLPQSDDCLYMTADIADTENIHIIPIHGKPEVLKSVRSGVEIFRKPVIRSYNAWDVMDPRLDQVIALLDARGHAVGSVPAVREVVEQEKRYNLMSHIDAFRAVGVTLMRERTEAQFSHLIEQAEKCFGPETVFGQKTRHSVTIEQFLVLENAFRVVELLEKYHNDSKTLDAIYYICGSPVTESLVQICDTPEELQKAALLAQENPGWIWELYRAYNTLQHDTITAGDQTKLIYERPLANHIFRLGQDLIKTALIHHGDPGFREDFLKASFLAIGDTLNDLHAIRLPDYLPKEADMHQTLAEFAVAYAPDVVNLSIISPVVERYLLLKLEHYVPGDFARARSYFYNALGESLYAHANETTGDDELQLSLLTDVFQELVRIGYWKKGDILQDAGSGDGNRILLPFLSTDVMQGAKPSKVYAVDGDQFPQPSHGLWTSVQQQFEDPEYPKIHASHLHKEGIVPIDAITGMWSPPNDSEGPDQQRMLTNFSLSLKKREGDSPGGVLVLEVPMGYIQEMIDSAQAHGRREMGRVDVTFPLEEGKTITKPFEIMLKHNIIVRAARAGFVPSTFLPEKATFIRRHFIVLGKGKIELFWFLSGWVILR